ncbi:MAG: prolipoprotein diacylglyceryl transferase [Candidatus Eisenbacteria bacterium]|uniref:Phosphatidylglycerol--prolipoprotein diacylglyceryl transferase n=1 Tax=Eiseniibacteriota bacterium TaxID=2212470 RepID=A0A849SI16_UNCEI|nr:prolipoprotein diacylglyceryl transferase [Candidatus Eisenbacteria bacterium]
MYPEILHWGPLHIRSYGLMLAIAFLVGTGLALREAKRRGLDEDRLVSVILVVLIASVLGARALYVMEHIGEFRREWTSMFALWQGGLTLYGGIVAGAVAGLVAARRFGLPMWTVADVLTPGLALGTAIGRVGCYLNGCCYGRPTLLPWGVKFPPDSFAGLEFGNALLHPSQLYFSVVGLVLFALAWGLRRRFTVPGTLFWSFLLVFGLARVPLDLTRAYEKDAIVLPMGATGVTESQVMSVALALFAVLMLVRLRRGAAAQP